MTKWTFWLCLCAFALAFLGRERSAAAENACPPGNVLVHAKVSGPIAKGELAIVTDGAVVLEGSPWPKAETFVALRGPVTWELENAVALQHVFFQVDADQTIDIDLSADGETWTHHTLAPHETLSGMISRSIRVASTAKRLRVSTPDPAGVLAISEIGATCDAPPVMRVIDQRSARAVASITPPQVSKIKIVIILLALFWVGLAYVTHHRNIIKRARDVLIAACAFISIFAFSNFGEYRYPSFIHDHDVFHYFLGAKYFPEIGYDGLYDCAAVAEAEAGFAQRVLLRPHRDLRTNHVVTGEIALSHADECHTRFGEDRFRAFATDVAYFANARTVEDWHRVVRDHGFNASPTWIAVAGGVARRFAASESTIGHRGTVLAGNIGPLDPILLLIAASAIVWAFGWRAASVATIVFACNPLSDFEWIGGGFLRQLWFVFLVGAICLLARKKWIAGGVALGLASLVQLFPALSIASLVIGGAIHAWRRRRADRALLRIILAAAATIIVAGTLSIWGAGRTNAWSEFATNTAKHASTPSSNLVGLEAALSFRWSTRARMLFDEQAAEPNARIRAARLRNYEAVRPIHWLAIAGTALALFTILRRTPRAWWWVAGMGLLAIPIVMQSSSYYASWLVVLALLAQRHRQLLLALFAALGVWLLLTFALGLAEGDVYYAWASWMLVIMTAACLVLLVLRKRPARATGVSGSS